MSDASSATPLSTPPPAPPAKDHGRAGRDLRAAVASAVVLLSAIALSLLFWKTAFMLIVAAAVVVAIWELHRGFHAKGIDLPEQPLMVGGVVMVVVAYFWGAPALVTATAVTALVIMLWLLRRGVPGYVQNATAHGGPHCLEVAARRDRRCRRALEGRPENGEAEVLAAGPSRPWRCGTPRRARRRRRDRARGHHVGVQPRRRLATADLEHARMS